MRKRLVVCLTLFIGLAFATVGGYWFFQPHPRIDQASVDKIKPGMTEAQVIDIIGAPPGDYGVGDVLFSTVTLSRPAAMGQPKWWWGQQLGVVVTFNPDGTVESARSEFVGREHDSYFHMLCCRLHLSEKNPGIGRTR